MDHANCTPLWGPILFVCIKKGMLRMYITFRMLSKQTKINAYIIPRIIRYWIAYVKLKFSWKLTSVRYITKLPLDCHTYTKPLFLSSINCLSFWSYNLDWRMHQQYSNIWLILYYKRHWNISYWHIFTTN